MSKKRMAICLVISFSDALGVAAVFVLMAQCYGISSGKFRPDFADLMFSLTFSSWIISRLSWYAGEWVQKVSAMEDEPKAIDCPSCNGTGKMNPA